jgi:Zn-dependent protease/predicted transcriptional regulator
VQPQITLGRIFGVEIGLHYSWLIIAFLLTLSLVGHFQTTHPTWGASLIWMTAVITSLFFFASIVAHELSHAAVARASGLPVRSVTLFALGGVAHIEKEATTPATEFWMGLIGPIASVVIGFLCLGVAWALGWTTLETPETPFLAMLVWLGYINIILALFNLIPGFPLDGGRVLRAILWWVTGDVSRSTRIAAGVGQLIAFGLIAFGLIRFFGGAGFGSLWLAFIGWFLLDAARTSAAQVEVVANLRGVHVGDIMSQDCVTVDGRADLQTFAENYVLRTGRRCFVIKEHDDLVGLVTPSDMKTVDRERWPSTPVSTVMRPVDQLRTVGVTTPVTEALETMRRDDVNQLPVVSNGHFKGIISRGQIIQFASQSGAAGHVRSGLRHLNAHTSYKRTKGRWRVFV